MDFTTICSFFYNCPIQTNEQVIDKNEIQIYKHIYCVKIQ